MADLTQNAVEGLLGLLTSIVKDEVRLQGGVQGDIQFIKDELDSMNGFLLHLTKTETAHNDQHRAWMKQVRDIAYIAHDSIELYMREFGPLEGSFWASVLHFPVLLYKCPKRRDLAKQLHELKDRVREVGERRLRYGVSVPDDAKLKPEPVDKDSKADEKREEFLHALEEDARASPPSFSKAKSLLPGGLTSEAGDKIDEILKKCADLDSKKMFLCALFAYPHVTKDELEATRKNKLEGRTPADVSKEVMLFSYSKLPTHYKCCLQYLTTFKEEASVSRTSLVRRWVAEGLVARGDGIQSMEEAGERCFDELVFRGFVRPAPPVVPGKKIKSCKVEDSVWGFVFRMAETENFVGALPTHLVHQRRIREIAQRKPPPQQPKQRPCPSWNICPRKQRLLDDDDDSTAAKGKRHPMDAMAHLLKTLPEEYRLNVLDLGGCSTLKNRHLKDIITEVPWLKYLSIRNTDVSRLPRKINNLRRLVTLDIRQTKIKDSGTTHIVLPMLKHLLAGDINETESLAVQMPRKVAKSMEILRYVQIMTGKDELELVGDMKKLRKLGVVIEGNEDNMKHLNRAIGKLGECLSSLSVWIKEPNSQDTATGDGGVVGLDGHTDGDAAPSSPPENLKSLNMKYFRRDGDNSPGGLPRWIKQRNQLSKITLRDTQLSAGSLQTLGELESLCCLRLRRGSYNDESITLETGKFLKLRFLLIDQVRPHIKIEFRANAAPKLEKIACTFDKEMQIREDTISGISNLQSLEGFELHGICNDEGRHHVEQALEKHPKPVVLVFVPKDCP